MKERRQPPLLRLSERTFHVGLRRLPPVRDDIRTYRIEQESFDSFIAT